MKNKTLIKDLTIKMEDGSTIETGISNTPHAFSEKSSTKSPGSTGAKYSLFQKRTVRRINLFGIRVNEREFIKIMAVILLCVSLLVLFHYINLKYAETRTEDTQQLRRRNGFLIGSVLAVLVIIGYIVSIKHFFYIGSTIIMLGLLITVLLFSLELMGYFETIFKSSLQM